MLTLVLFGLLAFATVAALLGSGAYLFSTERITPLTERLEALRLHAVAGGAAPGDRRLAHGFWNRLAYLISRLPGGADWLDGTERDLVAAGIRRKSAPAVFILVSIGILLLLAFTALYVTRNQDFSSTLSMLTAAFLMGYYVPQRTLRALVNRYRHKLTEALPDMVDLLGIVLGTGVSLDQAFLRVSEELKHIYPELADELYLLTVQTQAGQERSAAFRQFVKRTGVEDIKALAAMIVQSERFGTSLAQALRVYSESLRTRRRLRAEASIGRAGIKMLFATVLLIFPVFFVITLVPSILNVIHSFADLRR